MTVPDSNKLMAKMAWMTVISQTLTGLSLLTELNQCRRLQNDGYPI
tara:strand:- start:157 stop:294 length:138 start_codon:yes stop_codon:yes gene_type:complete